MIYYFTIVKNDDVDGIEIRSQPDVPIVLPTKGMLISFRDTGRKGIFVVSHEPQLEFDASGLHGVSIMLEDTHE